MLDDIRGALASFDTITLAEMDSVMLMERMDLKYAFPVRQVIGLLEELEPHYRVLEAGGTRLSKYETQYFDTDGFDLYNRHHAGRANRYKVRCRRYVESAVCFFEIKFSNNKGRTIKSRVRTTDIEEPSARSPSELLRGVPSLDSSRLRGAIWVYYRRMTFVSKTTKERITLDVGLSFDAGGRTAEYPHIAIVELKRDNLSQPSPALRIFRKLRIQQSSVSKYCLGLAATNDSIPKNNFRTLVRYLQKLSHAAA